ncbi:MAG TPA: phage tail protein, partial [Microlunatus sp.]|nr:phage tail protein [Microlunatus sp.]
MVTGLATPHPLADTLPGLLREDGFARELCASFDDLLAPVLLTLDTFADYLDPTTTPEDMIGWLAQWLGLTVDPGMEHAVQRHELAVAGWLNATRGTRRSIELALQSALGTGVEV